MPCLLVTDVPGDAASKPVSCNELDHVLDIYPYFCKHRNMLNTLTKKSAQQVVKYADMFSAMGTEPRLRIMQLLLSAHPDGLVVGEIQEELDIPNSTLSHHLDKLKAEDLVQVRREGTFLRYSANADALQELLAVSLRRVLHSQPGSEVGTNHSNLQVGEMA